MAELYELVEQPELESPVAILCLDGWIDAGLGAVHAREAMLASAEWTTVAVFDTDALLDHRARRPTMHLADGVLTGLTWPSLELRVASDVSGRDMLMLGGPEPDHRWPSFMRAAGELLVDFGARLAVGLGAYPAAVPHTRPSRLAIAASTAEVARRPGFVVASIEAPAGVQGAIERWLSEEGVTAAGLWAQVPHYASALPYPAASAALIDGLAELGDLDLDSDQLHAEAAEMRKRLDSLVAANSEHMAMLHQLEAQWDAAETGSQAPIDLSSLPTGEELAAEVERFLREQGRG